MTAGPRPSWAPLGIDLSKPSAARVYDYYLGGTHNFEIDRRMAEQAMSMWPELPLMMRANRAFLRRAVTFLAGQGIRQFVDIGSGIPTVGNVHDVVERQTDDGRVVYVDNDPVAVAHSRAILSDDSEARVVEADFRSPEVIFDDPQVTGFVDLQRPIALLLVALLHFVADEDAYQAVARCRELLPSGSYLVISHASSDGQQELATSHQELYERTPTPMTMRTRAEIEPFFEGLEMVEPGLSPISQWRPDEESRTPEGQRMVGYAGVARKP